MLELTIHGVCEWLYNVFARYIQVVLDSPEEVELPVWVGEMAGERLFSPFASADSDAGEGIPGKMVFISSVRTEEEILRLAAGLQAENGSLAILPFSPGNGVDLDEDAYVLIFPVEGEWLGLVARLERPGLERLSVRVAGDSGEEKVVVVYRRF